MSDWKAYQTTDGLEYYYNEVTGETTWDKPAELMTGSEMAAGDYTWVPHPEEGYVAAKIKHEYTDGTRLIETMTGEQIEVKWGKNDKTYPVQVSSLQKLMPDLVQMEWVNDATIVHNLKERAKKDVIYTNVGDILISINPYKLLPLYTPSVMEEYWQGNPERLPPHVFTIAGDCFRNLFSHKQNQSVIISGESGAGKTEATKVVLQFLAEIAGSASGVEQQMLMANPILEGFGNAKTIRNNNSSRFGKWMEIHFDANSRIAGCRIVNYLLEKSRVTKQAPNERNYHIFYQLINGADDNLRNELSLYEAEHVHYLNTSGCIHIDGTDDAADFQEVISAMEKLNFTDAERHQCFTIVAAVMHLGNIDFTDDAKGTGSEVVNNDQLEFVASLLQVAPFLLKQELTVRQFQGSAARSTSYQIPLTPQQACDARDALSQTLYGNLFDWLVAKINSCLVSSFTGTPRTIGVLDIFGFEIFDKNSFEQLCINFANEKLQQHFNAHTFKLEEQVYKDENIKFTHVEFIDNQIVLDLVEKKPNGLLILLDEEIVMPKGSDDTYLKKINQNHEKHERFKPIRTSQTNFMLIHYAGEVVYDVTNFLEKNKDILPEGILEVMESSAVPLVNILFPPRGGAPAGGGASPAGGPAGRGRGRGRGPAPAPRGGPAPAPRGGPAPAITPVAGTTGGKANRKASLGAQFREQLNSLMATLNATEPHYIRCIKPNQNKAPASEDFHGAMVLRQLRYAGVFEAVSIRQTGYPFRLLHVDFWKRYRLIAPSVALQNPKQTCETLLKEINKQKPMGEVQVGLTKVLYRAPQYRDLELLRNVIIEKQSIVIQAGNRGWRAREVYRRVNEVRQQLRKAIAARNLDQLNAALNAVQEVDFAPKEATDATALRDLILEEIRVAKVLKEVLAEVGNKSDVGQASLDKLRDIVKAADAINFNTPDADNARKQLELIQGRIDTRKALQEGVANSDENVINEALANAKKYGMDSEPVVAAAKAELERIKQEKVIIGALKAALSIGAPNPGVTISNQPGTFGQAYITDEAYLELTRALDQADAFQCKTKDGLLVAETGRIVNNLRAYLANEDFESAENVLYDAAARPDQVLLDTPEIRAARDQINNRAQKADVQAKLDEAAAAFDANTLAFELEKANTLEMETQWYTDLYHTIVETQRLIAEGLQIIVQEKLDEALALGDTIGYNLDDYHQAKALRDTLAALAAELDENLRVLESREKLQDLFDRAKQVGMHTDPLDKLDGILRSSEEEFVKLQLKAAIALGDKQRIIAHNVQLKEIFFRQFATSFKLNECSKLKTPQEFARGKIFGKDKAKQEMLHWQKGGIHTSLTRIDPLLAKDKEATTCFKNILGYMGDKHINYPQMLAREVLQKGIEQEVLRDEIFLQIIKQLTNNPNPESVSKGWKLMELALQTFPPSREFENYLEIYLRQQGDSKAGLRTNLHETVYAGAKSQAPPVESIP